VPQHKFKTHGDAKIYYWDSNECATLGILENSMIGFQLSELRPLWCKSSTQG